jgi:SAM-dependent methyltransferase
MTVSAGSLLYDLYDFMMKAAAFVHRGTIHFLRIKPLFNAIPKDAAILEIGGGYNPRFYKNAYASAYHLDHASAAQLREKYASDPHVAHLIHQIQEIDFVSQGQPIETLVPQGLKFDVVFSSHALEHQVDLIGHLQSLAHLVKEQGRVIMLIPDYRCCFDALRFPTLTGDALAVHLAGHRRHRVKQAFDTTARTIQLNPGRRLRWLDLRVARFNNSVVRGWQAVQQGENPAAEYMDAHAWTFCPVSFELLMTELYLMGLSSLRPHYISPSYGNQFCVVLANKPPEPSGIPAGLASELEQQRLRLSKALRR